VSSKAEDDGKDGLKEGEEGVEVHVVMSGELERLFMFYFLINHL
jgi:hypothetical protein